MSSYLRRVLLLLELLRAAATRQRRRARTRVRAALRSATRRGRRTGTPIPPDHGLTAAERVERQAWRPRDVAERLARRARRERASGRQGAGTHTNNHAAGAVRQRYGDAFYRDIGARGGSTVLEERGVEYLQAIGARGGEVTRRRYGPEHYAEIGRKGGLAGRGRKRPRKYPNQPELPLPD